MFCLSSVYLICQRMTDGRVSLNGNGEGEECSVCPLYTWYVRGWQTAVCLSMVMARVKNVLSVLCIPGMLEDDRRPCVSQWWWRWWKSPECSVCPLYTCLTWYVRGWQTAVCLSMVMARVKKTLEERAMCAMLLLKYKYFSIKLASLPFFSFTWCYLRINIQYIEQNQILTLLRSCSLFTTETTAFVHTQ